MRFLLLYHVSITGIPNDITNLLGWHNNLAVTSIKALPLCDSCFCIYWTTDLNRHVSIYSAYFYSWIQWNGIMQIMQLFFQNDLLSDDALSWKAKILANYQLILRQCPLLHIQSPRFPMPREEFARWKILVLNKYGIVFITFIYISLCSREGIVIQGKC